MSFKTALAVLLVSGIALALAFAQVKSDGKTDSKQDAKTSDEPATSQDFSREAFIIEKYNTRITAEDDGNNVRERTAEVKILADAGVKAFAVLSFTYSSANEVVDIDYVRVRKPDDSVVKTPDYNIQDMPSQVTRSAPIYSDIHEKHVAVKGLAVGDVMEYLVRYRTTKPEVPGQFWFEETLIKDAIVKEERLEVSVPAAKYVKVVSPDYKPEVREDRGRKIYVWSHTNLVVPDKDPKEIPRRTLPPPSVQITTFRSWEEVGRWYGDLQRDPLEATSATQAKAAELTKGLTTDDAKIRAIYNFVSLKFHYIGLDFGIGRYQPHAADDVLGNGYGDCKDKHTLMASLLKAAGVEAWPALIHASRKLDPEVPSPAQFNHVITVVPNGGKYIWLDSTPEVAPYQLLMPMLRDKQALVIPVSKPPLLMTTPAVPPDPQEQRFTVAGKLDDSGTFTGHVDQLFRGDAEVSFRMAFRQLSQSQWREGVQRLSYGMGFNGEVSNVVVSAPDETDKPFTISYDYLRKNYSDWDNRQFTPPVPPLGIEANKDDRKPQESVLLGAPGEVVHESKMTLPPGCTVLAPKSTDLVKPFAEYHASSSVENGVLISRRRLVIKKAEVDLDNWESLRDFGKAVSDDEYNYISLNGGGGTSGGSDGDLAAKFRDAADAIRQLEFKRAEKEYQKIIDKDPKYPQAHLSLGSTFLMQGKVDAALTEFHKEQELFPNDARAYQIPALYLSRAGHVGDSVAEWRRLLKANPNDAPAAMSVALLLNRKGKYEEAAQELEKISPKTPDLEFALGSAYLKAGQTDVALPHLRAVAERDGKPITDPMTLNNVAYALAERKTNLDLARTYAEESLRRLDERSVKDTAAEDTGTLVTYQLAKIWDTMGWIYFQTNDLARAENYVHAAWLLGQEGQVGEHLGEIYEKQGKRNRAARTYELALASLQVPDLPLVPQIMLSVPFNPTFDDNHALEQRDEILECYKKLTGQFPNLLMTERLPNGEWSKTPGEELTEMRVSHLSLQKASGSAEFGMVFTPGRVESVEYLRGEESLDLIRDKLRTAHYAVELPADSKAKIYRRAQVGCTPLTGCVVTMVPAGRAVPRK
jgi:tetratricopeptide (TPR) repeat protein/transglutaminase-like putative cysteine protease